MQMLEYDYGFIDLGGTTYLLQILGMSLHFK